MYCLFLEEEIFYACVIFFSSTPLQFSASELERDKYINKWSEQLAQH